MTATATEATIDKLEAVGVEVRQIAPPAFDATIESVVDDPAVGVSLDDVAVSLADTSVTVDPTPAALKRARTGVTPASMCVTEYGSVVIPARSDGTELVALFVETHVVVLSESALVSDMESAFERFGMAESDSAQSRIIATGPSATADMGAPVEGAHGPKDVVAIVISEVNDA